MVEFYNFINIPGLEHYPHVAYTWLIMAILIGLGLFLRATAQFMPGTVQSLVEFVVISLAEFVDETVGHDGRRFFPLIATLAFFIIVSNLIGLVPGCTSPTASLNTNIAMALVVFFLYHYIGIEKHGLGYFKQFMGPVWWLVPMMIPIEVISHLARPVTLSVRLFGNIKGEDLVILVLTFLVPYILPVPMMMFMIFTSVLQTLVFILLSMVYISLALEEAH